MITLVADVGGTRIKLALMQDGVLLAQECLEARSDEGLEPQLPRMCQSFAGLCRKSGVERGDCGALAVAFPSLIDPETGRVRTAYGKYADAPGIDLARWAESTLGLPLVMENDARAALVGEWRAGAGRGSDDLVMVTLGTGVGTAALIGGRLLRGRHGQAGVLGGHMTVRGQGRPCTCGNTGCAESEASTFTLPVIAAEHAAFSTSRLREVDVIDYAAVLQLARERDPCAMALRTQALDVWSDLIVNLIHAYDPERVILGGGIVAGSATIVADLEHRVLAHVHTPWGRVELRPAQLGDAAALYGCEFLTRERRLLQ